MNDPKDPILIIGIDSSIGKQLALTLKADGYIVIGTTRRFASYSKNLIYLDLSNNVEAVRLPRCKAAIFCAAVTSIEQCCLKPDLTRKINVTNTMLIARKLAKVGAHLILPSSNAVFDGKSRFVKVNDPVCPKSEYGRQKVDLETQLLNLDAKITVVRLTKVIPPDMPLFKGWITDLRENRVIHPYADKYIAPLSLQFVVKIFQGVLETQALGILQASATADISYADAAKYLAEQLRYDVSLVKPISCATTTTDKLVFSTTMDVDGLSRIDIQAPPPWNALDDILSPLV